MCITYDFAMQIRCIELYCQSDSKWHWLAGNLDACAAHNNSAHVDECRGDTVICGASAVRKESV